MGPFGSTTLSEQVQRSRNFSGGSFSSDSSSEQLPVFTSSPPTGYTDINTLAMLLSSSSLKDNLNAQVQPDGKSVGGSRYKTEMCRSFMETGQCKYGDKCQFAHGNTEQRAMPRHPKYKTELCRTFHTTGLCPYGMRCHFVHNEDPSKLGAILHSKQSFLAQQAAQEMAKQAATLRAHQKQLYALVSQVQQQLVTNIAMQNTVNAAMHTTAVPQAAYMQQMMPQLVQAQLLQAAARPTAVARDSLGSVTDTPPESPICGSPVFNSAASSPKSCDVSPPPGFAPLGYEAKRSMRNAFDFSTPSHIDSDFCYELKAMDLDSSSCSLSSGSYTPPPSPDSFCQSPLDSPRSARLPIFSQIAAERRY